MSPSSNLSDRIAYILFFNFSNAANLLLGVALYRCYSNNGGFCVFISSRDNRAIYDYLSRAHEARAKFINCELVPLFINLGPPANSDQRRQIARSLTDNDMCPRLIVGTEREQRLWCDAFSSQNTVINPQLISDPLTLLPTLPFRDDQIDDLVWAAVEAANDRYESPISREAKLVVEVGQQGPLVEFVNRFMNRGRRNTWEFSKVKK